MASLELTAVYITKMSRKLTDGSLAYEIAISSEEGRIVLDCISEKDCHELGAAIIKATNNYVHDATELPK